MKVPKGKGLYLRNIRGSYDFMGQASGYLNVLAYARALGIGWVAALHNNASDLELVELRRGGLDVYLYLGPAHMLPGAVMSAFAEMVARARRLGLEGVIVDTEDGWSGASRAQAEAIARAMVDAARLGLSIGWTSFPAMPHAATIGQIAGAYVWANPQLYGATTGADEPAERARFIERWKGYGWRVIVPAVAGWGTLGTGENPAAYLASFGRLKAAIFWTTATPPRPSGPMFAAMADWQVGGSTMTGALLAVGFALLVLYGGSRVL